MLTGSRPFRASDPGIPDNPCDPGNPDNPGNPGNPCGPGIPDNSKSTVALLWLGWSLASKIDVETSHLTR